MVLFHGTSKRNGEAILREGVIRCHCSRVYTQTDLQTSSGSINLATTDGYVYLTPWLPLAAKYGYQASVHTQGEKSDKDSFYVFEINIPENILLSDNDELRIHNIPCASLYDYKSSLTFFNSVCVNQDLLLHKYCSEYLIASTPFAEKINEMKIVFNLIECWDESLVNEESKYIYDSDIDTFCKTFSFIKYQP